MESKINVTVRIKPLSEAEKQHDKNNLWSMIGDQTIMNVRSKEMFSFDNVFGDGSNTQNIFDNQVSELVSTSMSGINVTVFAYGQTSSGKTFTMRGNDRSMGLIPLSVHQVFDSIQRDTDRDYDVSVSYLEVFISFTNQLQIYNETLNDLIDPNNKNLEIRESIGKGIYINRLKECSVKSREEVMKYMHIGDESRIIAETKLNEQSSRSHTVFRINIQSKPKNDLSSIRVSQLNLVDLAGSEGASRTQTDGLRLREGSNINRSLLALSNVINRLSSASGGKTFINYRDSKLTRILQPALGGNSKTAIICTITQTISNYQETLNTLHFGQKAKHVKTTVNVNEISQSGMGQPDMEKAQKEINELKSKLKEYECKVMELQTSSISKIIESKGGEQYSQMQIDTSSNNCLNSSSISASAKEQEFTVLFLKDQLKFMTDKVRNATCEVEDKERLIQKLEHEKREFQRNFESLELEHFQMQEKIAILSEKQQLAKPFTMNKQDTFMTPQMGKQQNKKVLEEDGIQCFDLNQYGDGNSESDLLRLSIGLGGFPNLNLNSHNTSLTHLKHQKQQSSSDQLISDQLLMFQELERLKRENATLNAFIMDIENKTFGDKESQMAVKEELEMLKEETLMKDEEITKYQRHLNQINDELHFYKTQNNDLLNRVDEFEKTLGSDVENASVIIYHNEAQIETTKLLKDENQNLKLQIQKLREEIKQLGLDKSKTDSLKAELEYTHRASEYNVEILKNQIENLNNEICLMRKQNEKQKKTIDIIRQTNDRLSHDLDHYKKLNLQKAGKKGPTTTTQLPTSMMNEMTPSRKSQRGSLTPQMPQMMLPPSPMVFKEEISPIKETSFQEVQVSLLDMSHLLQKDSEIQELTNQINLRQQKIDDLEKQLTSLQSSKAPQQQSESESLKKLRFDNQILMSKLSEYKKAEKGAKDIVSDYEQMKMKYFNVLTENSNQKSQLSSLIQAKLDNEMLLQDLQQEKDRYINDLYALRMDITRKMDDNERKQQMIEKLQQESEQLRLKGSEMLQKEKEVQGLQTDIENFLRFFSQVDKHLRSLVKLLRENIMRAADPKVIEHHQKQIKTIESLLDDLRRAIQSRDYSIDGASRLIESLFLLSSESMKDVMTSAVMSDKEVLIKDQDTKSKSNIHSCNNPLKRRKLTHDGDFNELIKNSQINDGYKSSHKENRYDNPQPFMYNMESADEQGTTLRQINNENMILQSKKKRSSKQTDKAVSFKKIEMDQAAIRRSVRIKDKGTTESDCC